jgi:hypothetical protein
MMNAYDALAGADQHLLGRAVLPTGVTPLTAVATTVRYGNDPHEAAPLPTSYGEDLFRKTFGARPEATLRSA